MLDGISPYFLHFDYRQAGQEALGCLVVNHPIRKALYEEVEALTNVQVMTDTAITSINLGNNGVSVLLSNGETIEAALIAAAAGRFSETRRKAGIPAVMRDFGNTAIVCRMKHDKPHHHIAYECFHYPHQYRCCRQER